MEDWQIEFEWLKTRHAVKDNMNLKQLPDLNAVLFLIGIQELGRFKSTFTKEEKQDLMHIAICELLSQDGYFEFVGRDDDGWPHYKPIKPVQEKGVDNQEKLLTIKAIEYFKNL